MNVNDDENRVCWIITVAGIEPATLAHIHQAPKDVNGAVKVDLMPPLPNPTSFGCTNNVRRGPDRQHPQRSGRALRERPQRRCTRAGAVRGQLKQLFGGMAPAPLPT